MKWVVGTAKISPQRLYYGISAMICRFARYAMIFALSGTSYSSPVFSQTTASPRPAIPSPFTSPKATPSQPQVPNLATPSIPARDTFSTPGMTPSFPSDTDITSPQHDFLDSSFNISLVSDTSSIDDSDISLPSALSTPTSMRARDATRSPLVGLGLFGLYKKDGQPFDGLGVLPPRSSPWDREPEVMEGRLSDAFLAEVWHTFSEDPFHGHVLTSISECDGELSEEEDERGTREGTELQAERGGEETRVPEWEQERATMAGRIAVETSSPKRDAEGSKLIVTRHLSTSTISSELKRRQRPSVVKRRASMPVWLI